ncbi:CoA transferase [Lutimaribacter marinistellae]|uniref:CoA transferase n=1 Tax=Lutimaribacter marinistellae TaxID=1820329 RepID=A0ABV7TCQ1_9RHOB
MDDLSASLSGGQVAVTGEGVWRSAFAVTELATRSMGAVGSALAGLIGTRWGKRPEVTVDRRLASLWFSWSLRPEGWELPAAWDPVAGDYEAQDGWIRLHTNAPHHRRAALSVLGCDGDRDAVRAEVSRWAAAELEAAIVAAGGAAAAMRSRTDWMSHPQGRAVAAEPLVHWADRPGHVRDWGGTIDRPLRGLRVLDLTRVLAGPVATRTLAGFGAEVLRIDPPDWEEPGVVPEVTLGKRCARLDLKSVDGRKAFEALLARADLLVHGYRPGALDAIISPTQRQSIAPGLIEVALDAYGWTGPWAGRRGFDSLLQMSSGIADEGMRWAGSDRPHPLPVQALDHATGYLMAAAAIVALDRALKGDGLFSARLSLARTAELLAGMEKSDGLEITGIEPSDLAEGNEQTAWGTARRLQPALCVAGTPMSWASGAATLGSSHPTWR